VGVFVSYSSRDKDAVKNLTQDLQDAEEQVWLDQRLAGGDAWWRAILEQIRGCDAFIFALSQNSIQSKPCQAELHYAQDLGVPILPVQVGHVDSMQLNPLATVQTVDYRTSTSTAGMRLLAALHRAKTQRQPLPSPLPPEPEVPFEYLIRLYTTVAGTDQLSPRDQAALVTQLQFGLREDGDHDAARKDIVMLLTKLRDREDVTYRTRTDVDAILASIDAEANAAHASQPANLTATGIPPASTGSHTATTATTEPRVDTPPPNTTAADKMTVAPENSQRQTETTRGRQKVQSPAERRGTRIIVRLAVAAVVLIAVAVPLMIAGVKAQQTRGLPQAYFIPGGIFIAIAAALIITALLMPLVRRIAASRAQRLPSDRSGLR
jgi:hypothetical protein